MDLEIDNMDFFDFSSALNIRTIAMDRLALRWAWESGLFEHPSELEQFRLQKVNWFAGYLFPESNPDKLFLIMKFFLGLFLLDDLMEGQDKSKILVVLEGLNHSEIQSSSDRLGRLISTLLELKKALSTRFVQNHATLEWEEGWKSYVNGLVWELKNKLEGRRPSLQEYRNLRPFASGVFLAILLAREETLLDECRSELLELEIGRFICLANDISSFEKEFSQGEFHNEVYIQSQSMGDEALIWAKKELKMQGKRINTLSKVLISQSSACQEWIKRLHLLIGGCLAWSALTPRYQGQVNGKSKFH